MADTKTTSETSVDSIETNSVDSTAVAPAATNNFNLVLDAAKAKAIRTKLGDRTYFSGDESATAIELAGAHLEKAAAETETFYGLPIILGERLDTASNIIVATVGVRDKGNATTPARNGYKAIVVFAQPTVEEVLSDDSEAAKAFVAKLIERELTDVAYSGIRAAETPSDLETVMSGLPTTVAELVENSRTSSAGDSSFDTMWSDFRKGFLKVKQPELEKMLPSKPEIAKAIKSASYARANPATKMVEEAGLFVKIAAALVKAAQAWKNDSGEVDPLDTSDIQGWLDSRDTTVIDYKVADVTVADLSKLEF